MQQYRRLGGSGVQRAIELLAAADLDLRGAKELPDDIVMEVLVARLSRLRRYPGSAGSGRSSRSGPVAATCFIRRLLRRAAWFWWMMPLAAAMSRRLTARRTSSSLARCRPRRSPS